MQYIISHESGISDFFFCARRQNTLNPASIHSHMEFIFVLDGELTVTTDTVTRFVKKGEVMIIAPYEVHSYSTEEFSDIFIIAFPPDYINEHKQLLTKSTFNPPVTSFNSCCKVMIDDITDSKMTDDLKKKALIYYTLSLFMNSCSVVERDKHEFDLYRKALTYISAHFTENIYLSDVSDFLGVSVSHLSRVLNNGCGSSFSDILNSFRIHHSKNLLNDTDLPISEIAYASGYGSLRNFNRIFKKNYGLTPKEMRQQ